MSMPKNRGPSGLLPDRWGIGEVRTYTDRAGSLRRGGVAGHALPAESPEATESGGAQLVNHVSVSQYPAAAGSEETIR